MNLLLLGIGAAWGYYQTHPVPEFLQRFSRTASAGTNARFSSVAEAKAEAIRRYPDLIVEGSELNRAFVGRYKLYQKERPGYFEGNDWPLRLVEEIQQRTPPQQSLSDEDRVLGDAFRLRRSNLIVHGSGTVTKVLPDDNEGRRHQRFILRLESGHTLLVAHNLDLAPRIPSLQPGERVTFRGEYEWNSEGGVIHWTHRDPNRRHPDGSLEYKGKTYQ